MTPPAERAASVACIADVHGVLPALEVVLAHPDVRDADLVVVCGDVGAGPQPVELLESMPYPLDIEVEGFGLVTCCHGTPRRDDEVVLVDTRASRWEDVLDGIPQGRTVVCGHTHMPFVRLVRGVTVVNPGSVGMPYGPPGAYWALLRDGAVSLHRETYDVQAAVDRVARDSDFPGARQWAEEYMWAVNTDVDAMAAFSPLDGRA